MARGSAPPTCPEQRPGPYALRPMVSTWLWEPARVGFSADRDQGLPIAIRKATEPGMEGNQAYSRAAAALPHILRKVSERSLMPGSDFLAPEPTRMGWGAMGGSSSPCLD